MTASWVRCWHGVIYLYASNPVVTELPGMLTSQMRGHEEKQVRLKAIMASSQRLKLKCERLV
jgi:hypothetical protein